MRWRVIGHGEAEDGWRDWLRGRRGATLLEDQEATGLDTEAPLLAGEPEAVVVGGPIAARGDLVRRAAELGLCIVALNPPGPDPDALYQVAVLPEDQAPALAPELPRVADPGWAALRERVARGDLGAIVSIRYEAELGPARPEVSLADHAGGAAAAIRLLLGEVQAVTATGADGPPARRVVHLRGADGRDAEVRVTRGLGLGTAARLEVVGDRGSALWEGDAWQPGTATLVLRLGERSETVEFAAWDARSALVESLESQRAGRGGRPELRDGILAMEVADAIERSRARGRTVELHRDEISELGSFKAVMASLGCGVILMALLLFVLAQVMRSFDVPGAGLVAWSIVPLLGGYAALQLLRLAARPSRGRGG